jgi:hypothetical protein
MDGGAAGRTGDDGRRQRAAHLAPVDVVLDERRDDRVGQRSERAAQVRRELGGRPIAHLARRVDGGFRGRAGKEGGEHRDTRDTPRRAVVHPRAGTTNVIDPRSGTPNPRLATAHRSATPTEIGTSSCLVTPQLGERVVERVVLAQEVGRARDACERVGARRGAGDARVRVAAERGRAEGRADRARALWQAARRAAERGGERGGERGLVADSF